MRPLLRAAGGGAAQAGAGRRQRLRRREVAVVAGRRAVPERAVLVDDVHTTGATLDACARALRAAGSRAIVAVSYARTLE
jgi:predicted amidophosphoribosyltransferase